MSVAAIEPRNLQEVTATLKQRRTELRDLLGKYPDINADEVQEIQRKDKEINDLATREEQLKDVERIRAAASGDQGKGARPTDDGDRREAAEAKGQEQPARTLADLFLQSAAFKRYDRAAKRGPAVEVELSEAELKATLTTVGAPPESTRTGLVLPGLLRRPTIAALIPQAGTNQNAIKYMEETTTTNGVAPVLEGGVKPDSTLAFTERTAPVRKIAGILKITDETLEDEPQMRGIVEQRLRLFLQLAEEAQLLSGTGVAPQITGILNTTGIQTTAKGTEPTPDAIYRAMTLVQTASFLDPSGVVMHPLDWQDIRLLRTADGIYIWGSPAEQAAERIWGLPVVSTTGMTQNTAIVAAFDTAMQIFRRMAVQFDIATQNEDDWRNNIVALRVEERLGLVVYRPTAVCTVTGI